MKYFLYNYYIYVFRSLTAHHSDEVGAQQIFEIQQNHRKSKIYKTLILLPNHCEYVLNTMSSIENISRNHFTEFFDAFGVLKTYLEWFGSKF